MTTSSTIFESYPRPAVLEFSDTLPQAAPASSWLARLRRALDNWSQSTAQSRAESRLWDIAMSDPRVMAALLEARQRVDSESSQVDAVAAPVQVPAAQADSQSTKVPATTQRPAHQGLSVLLEHVYQSRLRATRLQHA